MTATPPGLPPLIPTPRRVSPGEGAFEFDAATTIVLGPGVGEATLFAAGQLREAVRDVTGLDLAVVRADDQAGGANRVAFLLDSRGDEGGPAGGRGAEGYELRITPLGIAIAAAGEAGLFYGVQTVRQLLRTRGRRLPALTIDDEPVLPHRGVMLDVSRGKVPTLETLFALADGLAAYKYNQLQLYTEHTFQFPSHPAIGAGAGSLSAEDMRALDRFCRERQIELVPNLQSFGHHRALLSLPEYAALDEVGWRWTLTPAREETYRLLDDLYGDLLPAFESRWFNVNCDETWDLGWGQSRALADADGKGRLYLRHILRLRELAARHGRRIMLWADVLHHHPELLPELPDDLILLDWWYEAAEHYATVDALAASGRPFIVCPGTSSWNTLFPRLDNAIGNIRTYVRDGIAAGASGMLLADWGDYGHYQPLSLSWYPYLWGAECAWTGSATEPDDFDRAFAPLFFGRPAGDASMTALRRLGRAVAAPTIGLPNRSNSAYALFDDPLAGRLIARADPAALIELRDAAREAGVAWAALPSPELRHDFGFTAHQLAFAASKLLLSQDIRRTLRELPEGDASEERAAGLARLDAAIERLGAVRAAVPALASEFEARWLRHARPSEIGKTLDHYRALADGCDAALAWLHEQRANYAAGGAPDREAAGYDPGSVQILWDEGRAAMRRLAELAGPEAIPEEVREYLRQE